MTNETIKPTTGNAEPKPTIGKLFEDFCKENGVEPVPVVVGSATGILMPVREFLIDHAKQWPMQIQFVKSN